MLLDRRLVQHAAHVGFVYNQVYNQGYNTLEDGGGGVDLDL